MIDPILARDLMITNFETLRSDETLGAALRKLVALQDRVTEPSALVVLDAEERYQGLLTAHLLVRGLHAKWCPPEPHTADDGALHQGLLVACRQFLSRPVDEMLEHQVVVVAVVPEQRHDGNTPKAREVGGQSARLKTLVEAVEGARTQAWLLAGHDAESALFGQHGK